MKYQLSFALMLASTLAMAQVQQSDIGAIKFEPSAVSPFPA